MTTMTSRLVVGALLTCLIAVYAMPTTAQRHGQRGRVYSRVKLTTSSVEKGWVVLPRELNLLAGVYFLPGLRA